mgnify:CR=1 FL=1
MRGAARALGVRGQRRRGARLSSAHCPSTPVHAVPCLTVQVRVPTVVTAVQLADGRCDASRDAEGGEGSTDAAASLNWHHSKASTVSARASSRW